MTGERFCKRVKGFIARRHATLLVIQKWATYVFGALNIVVGGFLCATIDWSAVFNATPAPLSAMIIGVGTDGSTPVPNAGEGIHIRPVLNALIGGSGSGSSTTGSGSTHRSQ